jgi:hypothetical protein
MTTHAHRLKVHIPENREIRFQLPADVATGEAEVIVLEVGKDADVSRDGGQTVDEFLAARLVPPLGVGAVTLADMEVAIASFAFSMPVDAARPPHPEVP